MVTVHTNDQVWRDLLKRIAKIADAHAKVGILGDGKNATIGAIHEFGAPRAGVPERSFIRSTFRVKRGELVKIQTNVCREILAGRMTAARALGLIGAWGAAAIKKTITEGVGVAPPLAVATIKRKGSSRPLVDSGQLVGAISFVVVP